MCPSARSDSYTFETLRGYFLQDEPHRIPSLSGIIPHAFGLIDTSPNRWQNLSSALHTLNTEARDGVKYKLVFAGRHGEGYHNVAEREYGTHAWDEHWSKLDGDGELVWGPDPELTPLGISQAELVNSEWKKERDLEHKIPLPTNIYASPLSRTIDTAIITFKDIIFTADPVTPGTRKPVIVENLREVLGVHTCDKRRSLTYIHSKFPSFEVEEGFSEEDELWNADVRETAEEQEIRVRAALENIFDDPETGTCISITAHGGTLNALFRIVGHSLYGGGLWPVPTGGVVPILLKARKKYHSFSIHPGTL